ncbi:hypothetical protein [Roseibium sp. MMSF_3544]|uniref:hypothetical protein n=1 Tax=unclassified Roseibium TaxID=2629323 RepID=UPI00273DE765|nr:hypothetical protein [Roseibium sp. MMSF_3544]
MRHVDDLCRIAASGGGLDLTGTVYLVPELMRIAASASSKRAQIIIDGKNLQTDDLVKIGAAGQGCVLFKF